MKKVLKIFLRLFIFIAILFVALFIVDKAIYFKNKHDSEGEIDYNIGLINEMLDSKYMTPSWDLHNEKGMAMIKAGETVKPKKKGVKRILFIGDSFVWGFGNSNPNTLFYNRLKLLLKQEGYNDVEVYAIGSPGMSLADEMYLFVENNPMYDLIDPDLVIYCMVENDFELAEINIDGVQTLYFVDDYKLAHDMYNNIFWKGMEYFFPNLFNKLTSKITEKNVNDPDWVAKYGDEYGVGYEYRLFASVDDPKYARVFKEYGLDKFKKISTDKFIFAMYNYGAWGEAFLNAAVPLIKESGIKYYDFREEFEANYDPAEAYKLNLQGDSHPSEILHNEYAERLLSVLKEDYPEIIGKKGKSKTAKLNINDSMPSDIYLEKISDNEYSFVYPKEQMLTFPVSEPFVKLNFEMPVNINTLEIYSKSDNVGYSNVWINHYNEDSEYYEKYYNEDGIYEIYDEVFSLNINVTFNQGDFSDHRVYLKFT